MKHENYEISDKIIFHKKRSETSRSDDFKKRFSKGYVQAANDGDVSYKMVYRLSKENKNFFKKNDPKTDIARGYLAFIKDFFGLE